MKIIKYRYMIKIIIFITVISLLLQVHIVLLILAAVTFLHPLQLWVRSNMTRKQKPEPIHEEVLMLTSKGQ